MTTLNWCEQNQRHLLAYLGLLRDYLEQKPPDAAAAALTAARAAMADPPALETLSALFGLSTFEEQLLMLVAGVELDSGFAAACAAARPGASPHPTYSLALARFPNPHWSAVAPVSPLRRWRLLDVGAGPAVTASPLRIDERILHYLLGLAFIDERIQPYIELTAIAVALSDSQQEIARRIEAMLLNARTPASWRMVQLCGNDPGAQQAVAACVCDRLGLTLYRLRTADLPQGASERESFRRLWEREALLQRAALFVPLPSESFEARRTLVPLAESLNGIAFLSGRDPIYLSGRATPRFEIRKPSAVEQEQLWQDASGTYSATLAGGLSRIVGQFDLSRQAILAAATELRLGGEVADPESALWDICRRQSRSKLEDLAQRIEAAATWDDLVLPPEQMETLREIAAHAGQRYEVHELCGFSGKG